MESSVNPGPQDPSVLDLQESHVSHNIWKGDADRILRVRRALSHKHMDPPQQILTYLQQAGFIGVAHMGYCTIDHYLISALVERWRPETHTFHMPTGECTITLEDIGIISGLPIDGSAVTGVSHQSDWPSLCDRLLGVRPTPNDLSGARLSMSWLDSMFHRPRDDDDDIYIQRYARAYILRLLGGELCPDHSSRYVHLMLLPLLEDFVKAGTYSWGSAVLAYLYRELCKSTNYEMQEMGGACILLQMWAWHRFPRLAPTLVDNVDLSPADRFHLRPLGFRWHKFKFSSEASTHMLQYYRNFFDGLKKDEIVWQPYVEDMIDGLPAFCTTDHDIWLAMVPLIYFHIVEYHQPDRVMRQFGFNQPIPRRSHQSNHLHLIKLAGRQHEHWPSVHSDYIDLWNRRRELRITARPLDIPLTSHSEYMHWYKKITRRWITRPAATLGVMVDIAEQLYAWATEPDLAFDMNSLRQYAKQMLSLLHEYDHGAMERLQKAPLADNIQGPPNENAGQGTRQKRRTGLADTQTYVQLETSDSSSQTSHTQPPITATGTGTGAASQPPPTYYPPHQSYLSYPYPSPYTYPYPSPYPYPPPYPYSPPYPYPPPYSYPPYPGYPPYPHSSQPNTFSNSSHRPPQSNTGPSH